MRQPRQRRARLSLQRVTPMRTAVDYRRTWIRVTTGFAFGVLVPALAAAQRPAPPRAEGEGPFDRLILRAVTLIDGTGAPPVGPVDIVIERSRIAGIVSAGVPGRPLRETGRPTGATREIDGRGLYVL